MENKYNEIKITLSGDKVGMLKKIAYNNNNSVAGIINKYLDKIDLEVEIQKMLDSKLQVSKGKKAPL